MRTLLTVRGGPANPLVMTITGSTSRNTDARCSMPRSSRAARRRDRVPGNGRPSSLAPLGATMTTPERPNDASRNTPVVPITTRSPAPDATAGSTQKL